MRRLTILAVVLSLALMGAGSVLAASIGQIRGDYLETRSADVYTGTCVANSEVNLAGDQAILAWKIKEGSWNGVSLDGLSVVAVAKANATLGDPYSNPYPAKSVVIVDERATSEQRSALQAFAQAAAKELLANVVKVETAPIQMVLGEGDQHGQASMAAGLARRYRNTIATWQRSPVWERGRLLSATHRAAARHARLHPQRRVSR